MTNHVIQPNKGIEDCRIGKFPKTTFIPLVSWGDHNVYRDPASRSSYIEKQPLIPYMGPISSMGHAFKFEVDHCSTMGSHLTDGDILYCEKVDQAKTPLTPLQLYLLVLRDEFLCRRFFREDRHYEFRSDIPESCHLIFSSNLILEIWEVKSILKTNIPAPEMLSEELEINTYKYSTT